MANGSTGPKGLFAVTYEIVTPESAEHGDAAERGYIHSNGCRDSLETIEDASAYRMTLREALRHCSPYYDSGRWFSDAEPHCIDYRTGADLSCDLHPPRNVTPASYSRLKRLLNCK